MQLTMAFRSSNSRPMMMTMSTKVIQRSCHTYTHSYLFQLHWSALPFQNFPFSNPTICHVCQHHRINNPLCHACCFLPRVHHKPCSVQCSFCWERHYLQDRIPRNQRPPIVISWVYVHHCQELVFVYGWVCVIMCATSTACTTIP